MDTIVKTQLVLQFDSFIEYLKTEKHSSDNTLMAYVRDLNKFLEYANLNKIDNTAKVSVDTVQDFKSHLDAQGLCGASVSRCLSALRSFYAYLIMSNVAETNPARAVHNAKAEKRDLSVLSHNDIELLLAQPTNEDTKGIRDKAMLEVLYATGIKVSELISLNIDDVNTQLGFIRVGGLGQERVIPLYALVSKYIQTYIEKSRKMLVVNQNENALFVNIFGERMTRQGFWKILKAYAAKAGIDKDITPHSIRHSFAAHLLENGADIHDIRDILGHSDLASTQRYAEYLKDKLSSGFIKFHPHA